MHLSKLFAFVCAGALGIAWAIPTATSTYADFVKDLKDIRPDVIKLDNAINAFEGTDNQAFNVDVAARAIDRASAAAIQALDDLPVLTDAQADETFGIVNDGIPDVEKTFHDLSAKRSLFVHFHLDDLVLSGLKQLRERLQEEGNKVLLKIPSGLQDKAKAIYAELNVAISDTIAVYSGSS